MSDSPLAPPRSIAEVFDRALATGAEREALVTRTRRLTYRELDDLADRAANALAAMGVRAGDRVAGSWPNEVDVVAAFHGAMRIGAIWVGINRALAPPEKAFLLNDSGSSLLLGEEAIARLPARTVLVDEWRAAVAEASADPRAADIDPFAPAGIAYTSGTTGHPKGAVHSQHNLLVPGAVLVATRGYGPDLRKGDFLPLTILNMMVLTTLLVAQAGGTCIVMDRLDAEGVAEWIRDERVTTWNGPPALLHSLATHGSVVAADLASLDEVWVGGADCPDAIRSMFEGKFGKKVLGTYGLSEAPTVVSIDARDGDRRPGASGVVLPHLSVHAVEGEVRVRGRDDGRWAGLYQPMIGYWRRPDATAETLVDGELRTGDIGEVDAEGYLTIRDRKSLVIIRGGANVYPAEVERVLAAIPGVEGCAVLGVPDERLGERVVAILQPDSATVLIEDNVRAHCLANLAKYKIPERFVYVESLPRNSMGKVSRKDLADLLT